MRLSVRFVSAVVLAASAAAPAVGHAHFKLIEPASWIVEDNRGDPQKAGPCGGSNTDWGTPSFAVTPVTGGTMLHVKVQETIYHPGFYRIALAVNSPNELPPDPVAETRPTERGPYSVSGAVQNPVQIPVLADGLFEHRTRPTGQMEPFETDVRIPNISCKKCTLQVIQFMEEHGFNNPGGFTYHHCANLAITPDASKPLDTGWPAERQGSN
jgi:hypothetical protein